jgi:hypothetical protein
MRPGLLLLLVLVCACSKSQSAETKLKEGDSITSLDLRPAAGKSTITFDTGRFRGILTVEAGLATAYEMKSVTDSNGASMTRTMITVGDRPLAIEGTSLRLGDRIVGPLSGAVKIEIKKDGVFVDGEKKSDF